MTTAAHTDPRFMIILSAESVARIVAMAGFIANVGVGNKPPETANDLAIGERDANPTEGG